MHSRALHWTNLLPLAIILLSFALRLYRLDNQSFAFDEGWTSYAIHHTWVEMWDVLAPDNHPPLYYVLVKAFADVAGYGDFSVRFFSVLCGTTLVVGLYVVGSRLGDRLAGLSAALCAVCLPSFIYYSQEARMYSLLMVLVVLSLYSLLRILDAPGPSWWWVAYVFCTCGALYTHYFAALMVLPYSLVWLCHTGMDALKSYRHRDTPGRSLRVDRASSVARFLGQTRQWVLAQAATLLLYLPWLPTAIRQVRIGQGTWWRVPLPSSAIVRDVWRFFILGPRRPSGLPMFGPLTGGIALALIAAVALGWRQRKRAWAFAILTWILPLAQIVWLGSSLAIYTDRYALVALPGLAVLVGIGISACWSTPLRRWAWVGCLAAGSVLLAAVSGPLPQLNAYYHDPRYWREDFRRAAQYLMAQSMPEDTVILLGSSQPIMQYYQGPAAVLRFPQQRDSVQSEQEVVTLLRQYVNPGSSVRVAMYSWSTVDPQGLVEGQLRTGCTFRGEHWQTETGESPIRILNFAECGADFGPERREALDAVWDGQVSLSAYHFPDWDGAQRVYVVLWWRTLRRPDQNYSVFVHLVDSTGTMVTQSDKLPLNDLYPMRTWPLSIDLRDTYLLKVPEGANLQRAYLLIGLYDSQTGQRLPVSRNGLPAGDSVRLPLP